MNAAFEGTVPMDPLRGRRVLIAHHLVFTGYGHWLPNDPRGSGSEEIRKDDLKQLGDIHSGRKRVQPPRDELRKFYADAQEQLDSPVLWFDDRQRTLIGKAFAEAIQTFRYTAFAFAVIRDHAHLCVRAHRDKAETIWTNCAKASCAAYNTAMGTVHPVWSKRPHSIFLFTPERVQQVIGYIEGNPAKHGLAPQNWDFIQPYPNKAR
jgi:hypothetical protein